MVRHFFEGIVWKVFYVCMRGVLILLIGLFARPAVGHAEIVGTDAAARCLPSFPFQDGWLGADAAYSIPLPDGRSVWIFGDTLYGERGSLMGMIRAW